jgi:Zinc-finger associated domain (zf-AD)
MVTNLWRFSKFGRRGHKYPRWVTQGKNAIFPSATASKSSVSNFSEIPTESQQKPPILRPITNEISIMDLSICRICVKESSKVNIFESLSSDDVVANLIIDLADVDCAPDDQMPNGICETCLDGLEKAHSFRKMIRGSDSKLRDLMEDLMGSQADTDEEEIEIVVKQNEDGEEQDTEVKYS